MLRKIRFISVLFVFLLLFGIVTSGCGAQKGDDIEKTAVQAANEVTAEAAAEASVSAPEQKLKEVKLRMFSLLTGDSPQGAAEVFEELNKKLLVDINATVNIELIPMAEAGDKIPLLLASGDDFDILPTMEESYATEARKGAYLELNDLLDTVAPKLKADHTQDVWDRIKIDGKIYMAPRGIAFPQDQYFIVRGDILKKAGMESVTTLDDMDKYLGYVKDNMKDMKPYEPAANTLFYNAIPGYILTGSGYARIENSGLFYKLDDTDTKLYTYEEVYKEAILPVYKQLFEMQKKGYWSKNVLSNKNPNSDLMIQGITSMEIGNLNGANNIYKQTINDHPDWDIKMFPLNNMKTVLKYFPSVGLCINKNSKNPERAVMLIEKLNTDAEYQDLTVFGIKGKHYEVNADGKYVTPQGMNPNENPYPPSAIGTFMWDDVRTFAVRGDNHPEYGRYLEMHDEKASNNPLCAFIFDPEIVKNEVAAHDNVRQQLELPMVAGLVNADENFEDFIKQLKAAGMDKMAEEGTKQAQAFLGK